MNYFQKVRKQLRQLYWQLRVALKTIYYQADVFPKLYGSVITAIPLIFWWFPKYFLLYIGSILFRAKSRQRFDGKKENRYISFSPTVEGIGSQVMKALSAMALADAFGLKYAHRLGSDFHDYAGRADWEGFFGLGRGEIKCEDIIRDKSIKIVLLPELLINHNVRLFMFLLRLIIRHAYPQDKILFKTTGFSYISFPEISLVSKKAIEAFKEKYRIARGIFPVATPFDSDKIKVAVYVRRGEISELKKRADWQGIWRWVGNRWFMAVLGKIKQIFGADNIDIHLFSDAYDEVELKELTSCGGITTHLAKDDIEQPFKAFHSMVTGDISVLSKSAFSTLAGILSDGIKIIPSARASLHEGWVRTDRKGGFDTGALLCLK